MDRMGRERIAALLRKQAGGSNKQGMHLPDHGQQRRQGVRRARETDVLGISRLSFARKRRMAKRGPESQGNKIMRALDQLRIQAIQKCEDRIRGGEKRVMPATMPRLKMR